MTGNIHRDRPLRPKAVRLRQQQVVRVRLLSHRPASPRDEQLLQVPRRHPGALRAALLGRPPRASGQRPPQRRAAPVNDAADATFPFADTFTHTAHNAAAFPGVRVESCPICDKVVTVRRRDCALVVEFATQARANRLAFSEATRLSTVASSLASGSSRRAQMGKTASSSSSRGYPFLRASGPCS